MGVAARVKWINTIKQINTVEQKVIQIRIFYTVLIQKWTMHPNRGLVSPLSMHFRRVAHIPRSLRQWRSVASPNASKTETSWGKAAQSEQQALTLDLELKHPDGHIASHHYATLLPSTPLCPFAAHKWIVCSCPPCQKDCEQSM